MELSEKLDAIDEIKKLKARYFRSVDTKDRALLSRIFTDDAVFEMGGGVKVDPAPGEVRVVTGAAAIVEALSGALNAGMVSVHQGHCHEVEVLSPTEAEGVIAFEDRVAQMQDGAVVSELQGWGHYHERYRKVGDAWKIAHSRVSRLRIDGHGPWFEALRARVLTKA